MSQWKHVSSIVSPPSKVAAGMEEPELLDPGLSGYIVPIYTHTHIYKQI